MQLGKIEPVLSRGAVPRVSLSEKNQDLTGPQKQEIYRASSKDYIPKLLERKTPIKNAESCYTQILETRTNQDGCPADRKNKNAETVAA